MMEAIIMHNIKNPLQTTSEHDDFTYISHPHITWITFIYKISLFFTSISTYLMPATLA